MADLIDRQAALEDAKSWVGVDGHEKHLQRQVIEWLENFPSAQQDKMVLRVNHALSSEECAQLVKDMQDQPTMLVADTAFSQQWIPVSSGKMPKTGERVLVTCEHKFCGELYRYICKAYYVDRFTMESDGNWDEGCDEYHEEDDTFYVLEGWYEVIHNWDDYGSVSIEDTVVAWAELPEPWKGDT